jgi:hypothetical protein
MHCHQSLWKDGEPLFYDEMGYGGLSDTARWYIGGLLAHAPAVLAFTNPTVNSFHRLVPGFEAPVNLVYSARNRSACIRIPVTGTSPKAKRIEFRVPDPSSNPYLAFSAMLLAGLDGIKNKIEPPAPVDKDLYELPPEELARRQFGPVARDTYRAFGQLEELNLLLVLVRAEDQPQRRVLIRWALVLVEPAQVELHLPLVAGVKAAELELDGHQRSQRAVEEEQVEVVVVRADGRPLLTGDEAEPLTELEQERL